VRIAGDNTYQRTSDIRDRALTLLKARGVAETRSDVQKVLALAQQTISGLDLNGDEQIAPVPGEGGVVVAYQHAQLMAAIPLTRPASDTALAPTAVPTAAATHTVAHSAAPEPVRIAIGDNVYSNANVTVPVGTTVVWLHEGQRPHTVTADDDSFKSELMRNGGTFSHTFSAAGLYLYYCELHGGAGGAGMAALVQVQ
jgi:plastocyanin